MRHIPAPAQNGEGLVSHSPDNPQSQCLAKSNLVLLVEDLPKKLPERLAQPKLGVDNFPHQTKFAPAWNYLGSPQPQDSRPSTLAGKHAPHQNEMCLLQQVVHPANKARINVLRHDLVRRKVRMNLTIVRKLGQLEIGDQVKIWI